MSALVRSSDSTSTYDRSMATCAERVERCRLPRAGDVVSLDAAPMGPARMAREQRLEQYRTQRGTAILYAIARGSADDTDAPTEPPPDDGWQPSDKPKKPAKKKAASKKKKTKTKASVYVAPPKRKALKMKSKIPVNPIAAQVAAKFNLTPEQLTRSNHADLHQQIFHQSDERNADESPRDESAFARLGDITTGEIQDGAAFARSIETAKATLRDLDPQNLGAGNTLQALMARAGAEGRIK